MECVTDTTEALTAILERVDEIAGNAFKRWMSLKNASTYSDLSEDSLRRLAERGELTFHRPCKGKILVDRQQLDNLILGSAGDVRGSRGSARRSRGENGQFQDGPK